MASFGLDKLLENAEEFEKERAKISDDNWDDKEKLRKEFSAKNLSQFLLAEGLITSAEECEKALNKWASLKRAMSNIDL